MNSAEQLICSSAIWRYITRRQILPWVLAGTRLGEHVLEIGAGYGAATLELKAKAARVTSLEYEHRSILRLKAQNDGTVGAVCGDASRLPFADQTFSSTLVILVLHHLKSVELQDQMFAEAFRVLRPGGTFIAFEIPDGWFHRLGHVWSTFTPVAPGSVSGRLKAAGFCNSALDVRRGAFRFTGVRPTEGT
jgi:ubiquinone/menaquinone biosynthesis C-methylase UbiE